MRSSSTALLSFLPLCTSLRLVRSHREACDLLCNNDQHRKSRMRPNVHHAALSAEAAGAPRAATKALLGPRWSYLIGITVYMGVHGALLL